MLAKVAEARAIRKAFPAELSGLYAREELFDESLPQTSPVASELDERARAKRAKATLEAIVKGEARNGVACKQRGSIAHKQSMRSKRSQCGSKQPTKRKGDGNRILETAVGHTA